MEEAGEFRCLRVSVSLPGEMEVEMKEQYGRIRDLSVIRMVEGAGT